MQKLSQCENLIKEGKKCIQQTRIVHSSNQFSGKLANSDTRALQPPSNICLPILCCYYIDIERGIWHKTSSAVHAYIDG